MRTVVHKEFNILDVVKSLLGESGIIASSVDEIKDFSKWIVQDSWRHYKESCRNRRDKIMEQMNKVPINISNGTQRKPYVSHVIELPSDIAYGFEFDGLEELGLKAVPEGENKFTIQGTPEKSGDFTIVLRYKYNGWIEGQPKLERLIRFAVNPDPRTLWKEKDTPTNIPYYKPDTAVAYIRVESDEDGNARKDIVAASRRGRSHAQEGRARDDHFQLDYNKDTGWYIIAVADGAGSAKYSRKGSEIACNAVVEFCKDKLSDCENLETLIRLYKYAEPEDEESVRKNLGNEIYSIIGNAAFKAHKAISEEASNTDDAKSKDFATTLMFAICKKFNFGWFIASFWVGDGAICIYDKVNQSIKVLGVPDEGEYSGQTRFLTMPEIFADHTALYKRLRFSIVDDFTAMMLMTDGVSDPMFGTDTNLNDISMWNELWEKLDKGFPEDGLEGVDLTDDNEESKNQLLNWLNFWKPGEHDDRTIAILY